jgi:LiaI-LiaF-like transmembrane region
MRSASLFWGVALVVLGGLFLLGNLGIIKVDVWGVIWPTALILLGIWLLWGRLFYRGLASEHNNVPLDGATRGYLRLSHGAGRLLVTAGAAEEDLVEGDFDGGLDLRTRRLEDLLEADLRSPVRGWSAWDWGRRGLEWNLRVNPRIPLALKLETGASESILDFSDLLVSDLNLQSGASSTELTLPAHAVYTRVKVSGGAASFKIHVPPGVAASIRFSGGLASLDVDRQRFPSSGNLYQSPDYAIAENKIELFIEVGAASVEIR